MTSALFYRANCLRIILICSQLTAPRTAINITNRNVSNPPDLAPMAIPNRRNRNKVTNREKSLVVFINKAHSKNGKAISAGILFSLALYSDFVAIWWGTRAERIKNGTILKERPRTKSLNRRCALCCTACYSLSKVPFRRYKRVPAEWTSLFSYPAARGGMFHLPYSAAAFREWDARG